MYVNSGRRFNIGLIIQCWSKHQASLISVNKTVKTWWKLVDITNVSRSYDMWYYKFHKFSYQLNNIESLTSRYEYANEQSCHDLVHHQKKESLLAKIGILQQIRGICEHEPSIFCAIHSALVSSSSVSRDCIRPNVSPLIQHRGFRKELEAFQVLARFLA